MSGIYIKDMAVPKSGYVDVRIFHDGRATTQTGERPFYREMDVLEIPPHGRLIDADALAKCLGITDMDCNKCAWGNHGFCGRCGDFNDACEAIEEAPTVIDAEEET